MQVPNEDEVDGFNYTKGKDSDCQGSRDNAGQYTDAEQAVCMDVDGIVGITRLEKGNGGPNR